MKITVLDGFAVNPGDLDWGILSPYGEVTVYDRTASDDESIDRIRTTANAHQRMMVIEVMGDMSGWIGLYGGIAAAADVVLIPEIEYDLEKVIECINARKAAKGE